MPHSSAAVAWDTSAPGPAHSDRGHRIEAAATRGRRRWRYTPGSTRIQSPALTRRVIAVG